MENNDSIVSKEKIDQLAMWFGSTVSSAFFSSLERFSCVNISTSDADDEDDDDDAYSTITTTATATVNPSAVEVNGQTTKDVTDLPV